MIYFGESHLKMTSPTPKSPKSLQACEKFPKLDSRGCPSVAKETLGMIIVEAPDKDIKELLLKVKSDATFKVNNKAILDGKVKLVQETKISLRKF